MASITTALAAPAVGNDNPTLNIHLLAVRDYEPGLQFLDIMKIAREFHGIDTNWKSVMKDEDMAAAGYLDSDGWPTRIPEGVEQIRTLWEWRETDADYIHRKGTYVLNYEGEGELSIAGGATVLSQENGRIVFEADGGKTFALFIKDTDPNETGNHLRNITIVKEENLSLYEAGATFNPEWTKLIEDSGQLRFMYWQNVINTTRTQWDDRVTATSAPSPEVALEHMVQLANEVGADAWFTIPHLADDNYIRQFATYVRDNLDPALKAKVEYSNENWNWGYQSTQWLYNQAVAEWNNPNGHYDYQAKMATNVALIWEEVFSETPDRLINVIGTHTANPWVTGRLLDPVVWREMEPDNYVDPKTVFDEVAVTTYFGNSTLSNDDYKMELLEAIRNPNVDASKYLYEKLLDPNYSRSIPEITSFLKQQAEIAEANGMTLSLYEGGQHLHHYIKSGTQEEKDILNEFLADFVDSPYMIDLYQRSWDDWKMIGESPYTQFGDMGRSSKWGSFHIFEGVDMITARGQKLLDLGASTRPWWDVEGGDHYRQGLVLRGTEGADTLIGTSQEDYLLGGAGDDILIAGAGNDGLNGGAGHDRAILSGGLENYVIQAEGRGVRVTGPDGSDFLIGIEELGFDDGTVALLADLMSGADGAILPTPIQETPPEEEAPVAPTPKEEAPVSPTPVEEAPVSPTPDDGTNVLQGGSGSNTIEGGSGEDVISGGGGDDVLSGGEGDDVVKGNRGSDLVRGNSGKDVLKGNKGEDLLSGGADADWVNGGADEDALRGGAGDDTLLGGDGDDILDGGDGDDLLLGGLGNDILRGGNGADDIYTGRGNDRVVGGAGADEIWAKMGHNRIADFTDEDLLHFRSDITANHITETDAGLLLEHGSRSVLFEGLDADDLAWVLPAIVA